VNDDLLPDSYNTLKRWKNYFSWLFNVPRISEVGQIEIDKAEPIIPEPTSFEAEIHKLINYRPIWN
jgi:hypothetical protein